MSIKINGLLQSVLFVNNQNTVVRDITSVNSKFFHFALLTNNNIKMLNLRINAPGTSPNTDGIHIERSTGVVIADTRIGTGDDCISIGQGNDNIDIQRVHCGPGHGISVGSLGREEGEEEVRGLVVRNCTVRGTTNGLRIKTWPGSPPGLASNITFEDITMADVANPIVIDQSYCPHDRCSDDADKPSLVQISNVTFWRIEGTSSSKVAVQLRCSEERPCIGVRLDGVNLRCGDDQPCRAQFANVRGAPALEAPAPGPWVPIDQDARPAPSDTE
jgi:galacturan 1,4-alpha-galacturonidase